MLFGGLITIPLWGYLNTPIALMEVMISDLPHVMYHPPKATKEEEENRVVIMRHQQELIKKGGLSAVGLNLNFSKDRKVINGNELLEKLKKK